MDVDDKIKFIRSTLNRMAWHTYPYISSIVGVEDESSGQHVGSAVRVILHGHRAIVTAAHVIEQARSSYPRFALTAVRGGAPYELHGPPAHLDRERDLAAYFLPDDYPDEGIAFWLADRADTEGDKLATDYLFVHGFPAVQSRFSGLAGGLLDRSLPYGVMQREDDLPADIAPFQFAMDFDPGNFQGQNGQSIEWVDPHGLSGSPVWRIGASGQPMNEWSPELCLAVGVVTQWRPDEKILVATRWRHLLEMVEPMAGSLIL